MIRTADKIQMNRKKRKEKKKEKNMRTMGLYKVCQFMHNRDPEGEEKGIANVCI